MAKWPTLVAPLLNWPMAGQAGAIENARNSATEAWRRRVEREEVSAYLAARTPAGSQENRIVHSG